MHEYDPDRGPDPRDWLSEDEGMRIHLVSEYHERSGKGASIPNVRLHSSFHMIVENQVAEGTPPETAQTLERLIGQGLSRHDAVHAVGGVVAGLLHAALAKQQPFDSDRFARALTAIDVAEWLAAADVGEPAFDPRVTLVDEDFVPIAARVDWYIKALSSAFGSSVEGRALEAAGVDLWVLDVFVRHGLDYHETAPTEMDVRTLEELLLETFPDKVRCERGNGAAVVATLRGMYEWMDREFGVRGARECARFLTDELGAQVEDRLHDPADFGTARSVVTSAPVDDAAPAPVHTSRRSSPKIGRNAPCPCGSGRKYKKCCR